MRSFIKAHRRGESTSSDYLEDSEHPRPLHSKTPTATPAPSPVVSNGNSNGQFTPPGTMTGNTLAPNKTSNAASLGTISGSASLNGPPSAGSSTAQSSLSSPKKLLTPIKKMFSSLAHIKIATPSSNESLQNAVNGRTKRKLKTHRHSRSLGLLSEYHDGLGITSLNGLTNAWEPLAVATAAAVAATSKYSNRLAHSPGLNQLASSPSLVNSYKSVPVPQAASTPVPAQTLPVPSQTISSLTSTGSHPSIILSTIQTKLKPPILLDSSIYIPVKELRSSDFAVSVVTEEDKETKQVSFNQQLLASPQIKHKTVLKSGPVYNSSDEELEEEYEKDDSDSSSQFSFVKDMNCGRNTSVKYYKTVKSPQLEEGEFEQLNTFNENDLGSDAEGFSDYDFENNGLDDDYNDDEDVQYNKLFDDEEQDLKSIEKLPEKEISYVNDDNSTATFSHDQATENNCTAEDQDDKKELTEEVSADASHFSENAVSGSLPQSTQFHFDSSGSDRKVFHKSYHLSIQGPEVFEETQVLDTGTYEDDILENYLDVSTSPTVDMFDSNSSHKTPDPSSSDDVELYEVSSPLINGLTFGNNLRHRLPKLNRLDSDRELTNSNVFIHRSVLDLNSDLQLGAALLHGVEGPDKRALHLRALKSFHGSISDDLNTKIIEKTNSFENFTKLQESSGVESNIDIPENDVVESQRIVVSNPRQSVNELMNLLSNLEAPLVETALEKSKEQTLDDTLSTLEQPMTLPSKELKANRLSILGMMNLLSNLEKDQVDILEQNNRAVEKAQQNRQSILDMMSTLSTLESTASTAEEAKSKRNSINNMMQTLASLDLSGPKSSIIDNFRSQNKKGELNRLKIDGGKRNSWFKNDESLSFNTPKPPLIFKLSTLGGETSVSESDNENLDAEAYNRTFDEDLIDEINQFPEDFDFEDLNYHNSTASQSEQPNFLRSNSYNKKPVKAVMDNNYQCNKIETTSKTVTFYRSNSTSASSDSNINHSVSRDPSIRSMNSCTSVNEEQEEEEGDGDYFGSARPAVGDQPYPFKFNRGLKPTHLFYKPAKVTAVSKPGIPFR